MSPVSTAAELESIIAAWDPSPVSVTELVAPGPTGALAGILPDALPVAAGEAVPPLWHWLYFHPWPPLGELGPDGHPTAGPFLPPIPDRTRMFAGGRLDVVAPLVAGQSATQTSTLVGATVKDGRSGPMVVATVRHEVTQARATCLVEEQDLVYRSGARRPTVPSTSADPEARPVLAARRTMATSAPLLFRFSALTANSHRIHYDEPYARDVEGYPGLVVHGPLLAVLMVGLSDLLAPHRAVSGFSFRLLAPAFCGATVVVEGMPEDDGASVSASVDGGLRAQGTIRFGGR